VGVAGDSVMLHQLPPNVETERTLGTATPLFLNNPLRVIIPQVGYAFLFFFSCHVSSFFSLFFHVNLASDFCSSILIVVFDHCCFAPLGTYLGRR
jgi:hypothetical protein